MPATKLREVEVKTDEGLLVQFVPNDENGPVNAYLRIADANNLEWSAYPAVLVEDPETDPVEIDGEMVPSVYERQAQPGERPRFIVVMAKEPATLSQP